MAVLLACVLTVSALAQQTGTTTDETIPVNVVAEKIAEWDQAYARLKQEIWNLQRVTAMFGTDFRGRTLDDDLREFVLTQPTDKRLKEQRARVATQLDKGETHAATETLVALYRSVRDELDRIEQLGTYRMRHRQIAQQRALWQQLAATVPGYQTPDAIRQLEQQAVERLQAGRFEETSRTTYAALLHAYANERTTLLNGGRVTRNDIIYYERRTPCDEPKKITTGKNTPALANKTFPDYPAASKRANEEGTVYLRLLIGANGCALRYGIMWTSGWPALDDAALNWLETLQFVPAGPDGKPNDAWVTLPVVFRLDE